jgi:hypothetical protein
MDLEGQNEALRRQIEQINELRRLESTTGAANSDRIIADFNKGQQFSQSIMPEGSLGRVAGIGAQGEEQMMALRRQALGGLTGEEMQGQRDIATSAIRRSQQGSTRALQAAQAAAGVRGATASAQIGRALQEGERNVGNFERDLMLQNRNVQQDALAREEERQRFNLSQAAAERYAQLSTGFGIAQLGSAEIAAQRANSAQERASAAQGSGCFMAGTKIKMQNDVYKNIEEIALGDMTAHGLVTACQVTLVKRKDVLFYMGDLVTKEHAVFETVDGKSHYVRVKDSAFKKVPAFDDPNGVVCVFNFATESHKIQTGAGLYADLHETDVCGLSNDESLAMLNNKLLKLLPSERTYPKQDEVDAIC